MTLDLFLANAAVVVGMMLLVWLISLPMRDVGIVDIAWGSGFVLIACTTYLVTCRESSVGAVRGVLPLLVTIWGARLSLHLAVRNLGEPEDRRYAAMRESFPAFPLTSLFIVFLLQAAIMLVVALPVMDGIASSLVSPTSFGPLHVVGILVWGVGFYFEAIGDWQLARFKADPANQGQVLDSGLWRYTRHPNYFGDFVVWWGFFVVAIANGAAWWTAIGPVVMSIFLMKVSGVTLLEKTIQTRRPAYADYVRRTSTFFPWPPKPAETGGEP